MGKITVIRKKLTEIMQLTYHKQAPGRTSIRMPFLLAVTLLSVSLLSTGCSPALLPVARGRQESPWETFEQAKTTFDAIIPYQTSEAELHGLAFAPFDNSNIEIISSLDLAKRFMPNASFRKEELPQGVQDCIDRQEVCYGYELKISRMQSQRYGNVFLDLFNFKRKTQITGWQFSALVVISNKQVVHKLWSGKPKIDEYEYRRNPLGPLQESESVIKSIAVETTFD